MIHLIEGQLLKELRRLSREAYPEEAVGLIFPDERVVSLTNHSPHPRTNFEITKQELLDALEYAEENEWHIDEVVFWHSHPAGGVGPSRTDIQQKTPLKHHLVVTIAEEDIISTWY